MIHLMTFILCLDLEGDKRERKRIQVRISDPVHILLLSEYLNIISNFHAIKPSA